MITAAKKTAAPARRATLAEVLACLRDSFLDTAAYQRTARDRTRAQFDDRAATDLVYAIELYAGPLAKHEERIKVWAAFEAAYLPGDTTGATWAKMGLLANHMISRLLSDAGSPESRSDAIHASIEAQKVAGWAAALREVRDTIFIAEAKIAHAVTDAIAHAVADATA